MIRRSYLSLELEERADPDVRAEREVLARQVDVFVLLEELVQILVRLEATSGRREVGHFSADAALVQLPDASLATPTLLERSRQQTFVQVDTTPLLPRLLIAGCKNIL